MGRQKWAEISPDNAPFYFNSGGYSRRATREDFPELPPHVWDLIVSGKLRKGASRFERKGKTDLVIWKSKSGRSIGWYLELSTDIDVYLPKIDEQFGLDRERTAKIVVHSHRIWNELMWYYVHDKNMAPANARIKVRRSEIEFLKLVTAAAMTIFEGVAMAGTAYGGAAEGTANGRMNRGGVNRTSRKTDPRHAMREFDDAGSHLKTLLSAFYAGYAEAKAMAEMRGRYSKQLDWIYLPEDIEVYGQFREFKKWYPAMTYKGHAAPGGYWVWSYPFHFIFKAQLVWDIDPTKNPAD